MKPLCRCFKKFSSSPIYFLSRGEAKNWLLGAVESIITPSLGVLTAKIKSASAALTVGRASATSICSGTDSPSVLSEYCGIVVRPVLGIISVNKRVLAVLFVNGAR